MASNTPVDRLILTGKFSRLDPRGSRPSLKEPLAIPSIDSTATETAYFVTSVGQDLETAAVIPCAMRRLIAGCAVVMTLVMIALPAQASATAKPRFGVYTVNQLLGGGGHLEASISVLDPVTNVTVQFDCSIPRGQDTITDNFDSGTIPLHGGSFRFSGTVTLQKFTTVTENNAQLSKSSYTSSVSLTGSFTAHHQFIGTIQMGQSPCQGTAYTATRKAAPVP